MSETRLSKRQQELLELIASDGAEKIEGLAHRFGLTTQSIRRDINVLCELGQRMVLPCGKVDDELHGRVEQLGHEDQEYGQNKDRELYLADSHQQARYENNDGHNHVEAHVALGPDRGDHTPVGVLEAAGYALLALAWPFSFLRHAAPPLRPAGPSPSH